MSTKFVFFASITLSLFSALLYNISVFRKQKKHIVGMHVGCNICDILMYLINGGKSGLANSFVNISKNLVYSKLENNTLTIIFAVLRIILLALGYEGILTLLFILLEVISTIILIKGTAQQLRYVYLGSQITWVCYDYFFANILVACITATGCVSLIVAIIQNRGSHELAN